MEKTDVLQVPCDPLVPRCNTEYDREQIHSADEIETKRKRNN